MSGIIRRDERREKAELYLESFAAAFSCCVCVSNYRYGLVWTSIEKPAGNSSSNSIILVGVALNGGAFATRVRRKRRDAE